MVVFNYVTFHWDEPQTGPDGAIRIGAEVERLGVQEYLRQNPIRFRGTQYDDQIAKAVRRGPMSGSDKVIVSLFLAFGVGACILLPILVPPVLFILIAGGSTAFYANWKYRRWLTRCHRAFLIGKGATPVPERASSQEQTALPLAAGGSPIVSVAKWMGIAGAVAAFCVCCLICLFVLVCIVVSLASHSGEEAATEQPNAFKADIAKAVRENDEAVLAKRERDAERARLEKQEAQQPAETQRVAGLEKEQTPSDATPKATRPKDWGEGLKETRYQEWKTAREASMRVAASHLRPDQVAAWNKAMLDWNRLTPAQREARFRQEYQRTPEAAILDGK
jgi:hypothetical protein